MLLWTKSRSGELRVYLAYNSTSQPIIDGSQGENSSKSCLSKGGIVETMNECCSLAQPQTSLYPAFLYSPEACA